MQDVGGVKCLLLSADGKTLFVGGGEPKTGGFVQAIPLLIAFDLATGKRLSQYKGATDNEGYVTDLAWHPDGYVVVHHERPAGAGEVPLLEAGRREAVLHRREAPNCHSVAVSPRRRRRWR